MTRREVALLSYAVWKRKGRLERSKQRWRSGKRSGRAMDTIRVMIVDEHPLFRQGARCVLEQTGDCTVVAEAATGQAAVELARVENPDVVLIDALLTSADALEAARQLRHWLPRVSIIMLTAFEDEEQLFQSMK